MNQIYDEIVQRLSPSSFLRGLNYNAKHVQLIKLTVEDNIAKAFFKVKSQREDTYYNTYVMFDRTHTAICDYTCTCMQYENFGECKHIAASILKYEEELIDGKEVTEDNYQVSITKDILKEFYAPKANKIRKKLNIGVRITFKNNYYDERIIVQLKIGESKLYSLTGKYNNLQEAMENNTSFALNKSFTYDPSEYYLSKEDQKLLDYLYDIGPSYNGFEIYGSIEPLMNLIKTREFEIDKQTFLGISEENPLEISLEKKEEYYTLKFENINNFKTITEDYPYIYSSNTMYKLAPKTFKLYKRLKYNDIDTLVFKDDSLNEFTSGILPMIKDNIKIDENIQNIVVTKPKAKLFFDINGEKIECKVTLTYREKEINIFDDASGILRDNEYESNILSKLGDYMFEVSNKKIILNDIDEIGLFLETGIHELSEEYEIYTSQKLKDTNIVKTSQNSVTFSIGKDNIMTYNFKLDGIDTKDLSSILSSLKTKKRYHKLSNGNIIDLNVNKNIQELETLIEDLDMDENQIKENGEIPKYRAIYLDSLKQEKYKNLIQTNNSFQTLINNFHNFKNEEINLEEKEMRILRPYQKNGVKWLYNIYKTGFGGILADEMGLGKSIQLIYLIKLIIKENKDAKILIVAPTSLIYNWEKEFDTFGKELKYKVFADNKTQRENELENIKVNIMITSYGLIRNDIEKYQKLNFDLIAIDEAQNIKNTNAGVSKTIKSLKSNTKIALTGTPIENSVLELWSIFDFIMPGYLANKDKFQRLYNVKSFDEENNKKLTKLNNQIKYFILRRKKKDVALDLPDKIENNIYIELEDTQKKIYAAEVQKTREKFDEMVKNEGFTKARFEILQLIGKLKQICIDPSLVFENYNGESAKIEELLKIIKEVKENGHKMLLFTTYKKALDLVIPKLEKNGISSYYIDGSVPSKKRMELVEKFKSDKTDVFIITLKAGGTGLNLTSATVVIHLDLWWNPQVENQATDRAHRIGQKKTVEVIRLIAKGTIEERIVELQEKKKQLAEILVDGEDIKENQFSKLTEEDIKKLLSIDKE